MLISFSCRCSSGPARKRPGATGVPQRAREDPGTGARGGQSPTRCSGPRCPATAAASSPAAARASEGSSGSRTEPRSSSRTLCRLRSIWAGRMVCMDVSSGPGAASSRAGHGSRSDCSACLAACGCADGRDGAVPAGLTSTARLLRSVFMALFSSWSLLPRACSPALCTRRSALGDEESWGNPGITRGILKVISEPPCPPRSSRAACSRLRG